MAMPGLEPRDTAAFQDTRGPALGAYHSHSELELRKGTCQLEGRDRVSKRGEQKDPGALPHKPHPGPGRDLELLGLLADLRETLSRTSASEAFLGHSKTLTEPERASP